MINDEDFIYWKFPKAMGSALIKSVIQATISCKHDQRSDPDKVDVAEYILLQLANEIGSSTKATDEQVELLEKVFNQSGEEKL